MIIKGKLLAKSCETGGYITYVFQNLDHTNLLNKYYMCVQFPNWEQGTIHINEIGYLHLEDREEGIDQWFDGSEFHKYNNTMCQFIKFIPEPIEISDNTITL